VKKLIVFLMLLLLLSAPVCLAHSGGTDSKGGHWNRSTGEYHYHHGYSAHQHENGICPYETKSIAKTTTKKTNQDDEGVGSLFVLIGFGAIIGFVPMFLHSQRLAKKIETLERGNRLQVDLAYQRGKAAAENELREREANVRRREIAIHSAEARQKAESGIKINYRH
jgi:hypothetical protein